MLWGLWSCLASLKRGQNCRPCSGDCGPVWHGQASVCDPHVRTLFDREEKKTPCRHPTVKHEVKALTEYPVMGPCQTPDAIRPVVTPGLQSVL